jgi:hypothetical protein
MTRFALPGTVREAVQSVALVLDHAGIEANPARNRAIVKLPREQGEELNPPTAEHVAAVYRLLSTKHRLPLLFLDWSGARVAAINETLVGDYDEPRRRVRLRKATTKNRRALWIDLPDVLADAAEATMPHRKFRDLDARLFADSGAEALRTAIVGQTDLSVTANTYSHVMLDESEVDYGVLLSP